MGCALDAGDRSTHNTHLGPSVREGLDRDYMGDPRFGSPITHTLAQDVFARARTESRSSTGLTWGAIGIKEGLDRGLRGLYEGERRAR